uniref:SGF29 C-terminal domain-containing protein n=1 Tax=Mesocestoides corti TaxID=53468 RepID=A0A5K3FW51_MESCO
MEEELVKKINDLICACKESVAAERKCESHQLAIDLLQGKSLKKKSVIEQRNRLTKRLVDALSETEAFQKSLLRAQAKLIELKQLEYKIKMAKGPRNMRRGVLMSLLQESAKSIPMWAGGVDERPPPLCGAIGAGSSIDSTLVAPGDHVAALVPDLESPGAEFADNESWILAEVISFNRDKRQFQVEDVDAEEGKVRRYTLDRSKVILLPKWKANPVLNPEAVFPKGTLVLALYPQTTCFYRAVVDTHPTNVRTSIHLSESLTLGSNLLLKCLRQNLC